MSSEVPHVDLAQGLRRGEVVLWCSAALVVLTVHIAAGAWMMHEPPALAVEDEAPAAIMIEFAEIAEAVATEQNEITPDVESSAPEPEIEQPEPEETPPEETPPEETLLEEPEQTPPEELAEAEPVEELPDPVTDQIVAELDRIEVPIPVTRPQLPEKKPPEQRDKQAERRNKPDKPQRKPEPARQAATAQAKVEKSNRNAAPQTASGLFSSMSPARWQSRLMAHLERRKKYPSGARARREQGTVHVRFSIDPGGNVGSVTLVRSSGFKELDNEVLALIRRASPVPAPPPGVSRNISAPVKFSLR